MVVWHHHHQQMMMLAAIATKTSCQRDSVSAAAVVAFAAVGSTRVGSALHQATKAMPCYRFVSSAAAEMHYYSYAALQSPREAAVEAS